MRTAWAEADRGRVATGWPIALWAGLGLLLAARLVALKLNATDLFFDEAQYWSWSLEPAFGYYSKPPLIAWVIGAATAVCGSGEFCIRLPSPLMHTVTALIVFLIGRRLYGTSVGLWSALVFATLPGVSVSAGIISTDVPLLLCWALALWAFIELKERADWWPAVLLGIAIGLGMNAKYAMVFFPISMLIYVAVTPAARRLLWDARLYVAVGLGALLVAPNLFWNLSNSFATFAHTADNARWGGALMNIGKGFEFIGAQFGVFGPILFATLGWVTWRAWRKGLPETDRLLLAFTLPVLLVITAQGFVSRAHANWAATAYVAGAVLVTAVLMRDARRGWLTGSLALHVLIVAVIGWATWQAGQFRLPFGGDPFARTLGWRALAEEARGALTEARRQGRPFAAIVTEDRAVTAELIYYLRDEPTPVLAWYDGGRPHDHYELTRPYAGPAPEPVLLVDTREAASPVTQRFGSITLLSERAVPAGLGAPRRVRLFALANFKPK
jgi:4-amino-4-deoxy-L-arabinose transferase-like glycosyltransferase